MAKKLKDEAPGPSEPENGEREDPVKDLAMELLADWRAGGKRRENLQDKLKGHAKSTQRKALLNMQRMGSGLKFKEYA
jgi:hypothetical protein